ncbi:membrane protein [Pilimelia terevasa]|uniref:Membrane protein n=1 Tax=Pilimelia terevasa TaxID=53372 RepID=A0A8J3BJ91_9ACTN|nr:DUF3040 domain-containing protein [Pilimelia terevasa]GGK26119.1 membrane protein [Pilimelia terevasa]
MPLSEHEQRLFEQIERSLADDPKFASAVRANDPRLHARRRVVIAVLVVLAGLGLVVYGTAIKSMLVGVAGFVVMLAAAALATHSYRRGQTPQLRVVGGTAAAPRPARRATLVDRLEARWRGRPESHR